MAVMRYVGPLDEVRVSVAGNDFGVLKQGEALVVPDDLASEVEWSEHWEPVKETRKTRKDTEEPVSGPLADTAGNTVAEPGTAAEGVSDSNTVNSGTNENISTDGSENSRDGN